MGSSSLASHVITPRELTPDLRTQWSLLCQRHPHLASPFYSVGFVEAVERSGKDVRVCLIEQSQKPCGFFPYQFQNQAAACLARGERVGGELSDYAGIVADPTLRLNPDMLLCLSRLASFSFSHLDETQLAHGLIAGQSEPGLRIDLTAGVAAYHRFLQLRSSKFVSDTLRRRKRLSDALGELNFTFCEAASHAELDRLVDAKRAQYARTRVPDALASPWKRKLLHDLADQQDPGCVGVLSTLYAGRAWVASHFGLRSGGVLHYWFPVYNPELVRFAPGRLLLWQIIDAAGSNGLTIIDRGAGDSPAKRALSNAQHSFHRDVWERAGIRAWCARAIDALRWRYETRRYRPPRESDLSHP